jgi:hypothetical protein
MAGKAVYFGVHGSPESKDRYRELIAGIVEKRQMDPASPSR